MTPFPAGTTSTPRESDADDPRGTFLALFPVPRRSQLTNVFLQAIWHGGHRKPTAVLDYVRREADQRLADAHAHQNLDEYEKWQSVLYALDTPEALLFAAWAIHHACLPEAERRREKASRKAGYLVAWMAGQPPSERQIAYLRALGHQGDPPSTKLEASALIERLKGGRHG